MAFKCTLLRDGGRWSAALPSWALACVLDHFDGDVVDQFTLGSQVSAHGRDELAQFASRCGAFEHQAPHPIVQVARTQLAQNDGGHDPFEEGEAFLIFERGGHQGPQARGALGRVQHRLRFMRVARRCSGFLTKPQTGEGEQGGGLGKRCGLSLGVVDRCAQLIGAGASAGAGVEVWQGLGHGEIIHAGQASYA